jgi:hypothetical protein
VSAPDDTVANELRRLSDRIDTLQADVRRLGSAPALPAAEPGWEDERPAHSHAWIDSLDARARRRPSVPRMALELLFLAVCAAAAGIADLDAVAIAGVMVGAWVLVALIEWAGSRADRRRDELLSMPPPAPAPAPADPSWYVPPVEQTLLDNAGSTDSATAVTRLPAAPPTELEATAEHRVS